MENNNRSHYENAIIIIKTITIITIKVIARLTLRSDSNISINHNYTHTHTPTSYLVSSACNNSNSIKIITQDDNNNVIMQTLPRVSVKFRQMECNDFLTGCIQQGQWRVEGGSKMALFNPKIVIEKDDQYRIYLNVKYLKKQSHTL